LNQDCVLDIKTCTNLIQVSMMPIDALPDDLDVLRALVSCLSSERDAAIEECRRVREQNDRLHHLLRQLQRAQFAGTDDAIWRRIMVIPFPVTIPPSERDKTLADRLIGELPGILNWAMDGLREWRQQGLNPPSRVLKSTGTYREDNDTVGQWIDAACVQEAGLRTSMKELHGSYKSWCENSGVEALQSASLGKELTRRGFDSIKERLGNARRGIAVKDISGNGAVPMYCDVTDRKLQNRAASR
jgi:hypothetical protein